MAYVDASGKGDLGRLMLRSGWASVYVFENPFARLARYQAAAGHAKARRAAVWDRCDGDSIAPPSPGDGQRPHEVLCRARRAFDGTDDDPCCPHSVVTSAWDRERWR